MFYSISRKPRLKIAKLEGIAYIEFYFTLDDRITICLSRELSYFETGSSCWFQFSSSSPEPRSFSSLARGRLPRNLTLNHSTVGIWIPDKFCSHSLYSGDLNTRKFFKSEYCTFKIQHHSNTGLYNSGQLQHWTI